MANAVLMPQAGISVESCVITEWRKHPGDVVAEGDILFEYETDKACLLYTSPAGGGGRDPRLLWPADGSARSGRH